MALRVITKKRFETKVKKLLEYLVMNWYDEVADDFTKRLNNKIVLLSKKPFLGKPVPTLANTRTILITKHNRIYYRLQGNSIIFLNMFDTRRNPKRNPFSKFL